jgi:hypothetical protein
MPAVTDESGAEGPPAEEGALPEQEDAAADGGRRPSPSPLDRVRVLASRLQRPSPALVLFVAPAVGVVIALWLSHGVWGGRPPAGDDTLAHVIRAHFASTQLLNHGRLDGWDPSFIVGYQEFLFIGPGFTWAVVLVRLLTLDLLSTTGAVKVVAVGSFVLLPVVVAFCARSFGLGRRAAGLTGILALAVNSPFGGAGLQGLFAVGLLTHQFGALWFFLALGGTLRVLRNPAPGWVVFSAVALGALVVSHGISVMIFAVIVGLILVCVAVAKTLPTLETYRAWIRRTVAAEVARRMPAAAGPPSADTTPDEVDEEDEHEESAPAPPLVPRGAARLAAAYAIAGGLSAVVLLPLYAHRDLRGILTGWGTPPLGERLLQLWRGDLVFRPGVPTLLVAGFAYGLVRVWKGRPYALAVLATPVLYVVVASAALHLRPSNVVSQQLTNRGLGFAAVLAVLPLAALLARCTRGLGLGGDLAAVAVAAGIVILPLGPTRQAAHQMPEPIPQMRTAAAVLHQVVPANARFVTQRDYPSEIGRTKVVDPDRWLAWASGRNTLDSFNVESSVTPGPAYESEHITDRPPDAVADALARLGVTHLVTVSDAAADQVATSPRFTQIWRQPPLAIFTVAAVAGQPDPSALVTATVPLQARLDRGGPEHLEISLVASGPTIVTAALGYSPKWRVHLDGRALTGRKGPTGLLQFAVPAGAGRLSLTFQQDAWDWLGLFVSMITAGGVIGWIVATLRRRSTQRMNSRERTMRHRWRAKRAITPSVPSP